jgi:hypothetical protein
MKVIPEKLEDVKDVIRRTEIEWLNTKGQTDNVKGHISVLYPRVPAKVVYPG